MPLFLCHGTLFPFAAQKNVPAHFFVASREQHTQNSHFIFIDRDDIVTMDEDTSKMVKALRWEDNFFANEEGLIAVFDFDYPQVASFLKSVACTNMLVGTLCLVPCLSSLCCYPCFFRQQIDWDVYSQHVAITRDGIKYVKDKRH